MPSCPTCLTLRALHTPVLHVTRVLCALMPYVPHALRALVPCAIRLLVPHMHLTLRALLPHVPCALHTVVLRGLRSSMPISPFLLFCVPASRDFFLYPTHELFREIYYS